MSRFALLAASLMLVASNLVMLFNLTARPSQADEGGGLPDLVGAALNFAGAGEDSLVYLSNTDVNDSLRAVLTAHNSAGTLLGCAVRTLEPASSDVVYIIASSDSGDIINIRVFGLTASGSLAGKVNPKVGLAGQLAQVDKQTGATKSMVRMLEVNTPKAERQSEVEECAGKGAAGPKANTSGVIASEAPTRWAKTP